MAMQFIDLTHTLAAGLPSFPGDPSLRLIRHEMPRIRAT